MSRTPPTTVVQPDAVVWRLPDPGPDVDGVRLWSDFDLGDTSFRRGGDVWELRLLRTQLPPVDRLEYLFEVTRDGESASVLDPSNPQRVGGAFGDHSWVSLGYRPPSWLDAEPVPGGRRDLSVRGTPVGTVDVQVWSPSVFGPGAHAPLLLSHDGPEMDSLGELTRFVGAMIAAERLPPLRVGLLAPGPRDERYAANPAYADALVRHVVPAVRAAAPSATRPVLMGQSLGALAALHAEWTHPGTFAGLLLQSGSFFMPDVDAHESGSTSWRPITTFVAEVLAAQQAPSNPPTTVCFGSAEENGANNRRMAAHLASLGWPVTVGEVRDGHTFTCWRDLLDPHLTDLLRRAR